MKPLRSAGRAAVWLAALGCLTATAADHPSISEERIQRFPEQTLKVEDFPAQGWILDLGGGGEGIIGRMKGSQTIAIDLFQRELAGTPAGPLKIVMDATDLKFLDESVPTVTAFFMLMYVKEEDQAKVFREAARVLAPGGRFLIWDVSLPARSDPVRDVAVFRFRFQLPREEVRTGYGTFFPRRAHGIEYFKALAAGAGLRVAATAEDGRTFYLELVKPASSQ